MFVWGWELDPQTGQSVLTYHPYHVWIKTSQNPSQPLQKVAIKEKAESTTQPPALYTSPIPLKAAKVEDLKKIAEKHLLELQRSFYIFNYFSVTTVAEVPWIGTWALFVKPRPESHFNVLLCPNEKTLEQAMHLLLVTWKSFIKLGLFLDI